jgi:hypothetical protein
MFMGEDGGIVKSKRSICENNDTTPIACEHGKALPIVLFYENIINYLPSLKRVLNSVMWLLKSDMIVSLVFTMKNSEYQN